MIKTTCVLDGCDREMHGRGVCRRHYMKCWRGQIAWPQYTPFEPPSKAERFWAKVDKSGDCWEWTASRIPNGYGQFDHTTAHRYSMIASGFLVDASQVVDHLCRNLGCVNPDHLEVVTPSLNVTRGYAANYATARVQAWSRARTHCIHGHALTPENTYNPPGQPTWRQCVTCRSETGRRARARNAAKRAAA